MTIFQSIFFRKIKVSTLLYYIISPKNAILGDFLRVKLIHSIKNLDFKMVAIITGGRYIRFWVAVITGIYCIREARC